AFGLGPNAVSNGSYLPEETLPVWNDSYASIRSANYLLQKAAESGLGAEVDRWAGEALFFRAYHYWNLVKTFGGVPKIDKVLETGSEELYAPRASQAEIIDFILADLADAAGKLPLQSALTEDELGRVTRGAALSLQSRVALYQGTWAKYHGAGDPLPYLATAINAAEQVLASGEYAIFDEQGDESYKKLFILPGDDSEEVILARRYDLNIATHNWTRELWFNQMIPTGNLADMYLCTDGLPIGQSAVFEGYEELDSEFRNRDPRMAMTFIIPGTQILSEGGNWQTIYPGFTGTNATRTGYMLRKFLGETLEAATFRGHYDYKEFRYAEVLLNLAEALYERDGAVSDQDLDRTINLIRVRVAMPPLGNAHVNANGLDMLSEIRRERTVELAFEGFRRLDLRRWKTAEAVLPQAIKGVKFTGTAYEERYPEVASEIGIDSEGFVVAEPAGSRQFLARHYLNPLPLQQIQLSQGSLQQNEGW
ncbi:MAG TPA: RagB/SusD family nutrient uptake outer membrane protein, partial [Anseongella sp.]|nr:RagB/SusD family nutrient uptake outer membrane protein [Anseongella sp.]